MILREPVVASTGCRSHLWVTFLCSGYGGDPLKGHGTLSPATARSRNVGGLCRDWVLVKKYLGREGAHSEPVPPLPALSQASVQAAQMGACISGE